MWTQQFRILSLKLEPHTNRCVLFFTYKNLSRKWKMLIYFAVIVSQVQYALGTLRLSPAHIRSISSLYHAHLRTIVNTLQPFAALKTGFPPVNNQKVRKRARAPTLEHIYQQSIHKQLILTLSVPSTNLRRKYAFQDDLKRVK